MSLFNLIFFFFLLLTGAGALYILFSKNVINSAFALLITLLGVAGLFILLGADFLGITQIMVYIGGVLILLLFGIMMMHRVVPDQNHMQTKESRFKGIFVSCSLFILLTYLIINLDFISTPWIKQSESSGISINSSTVSSIGMKLMTDYILPFEAAALILMVALIGAAFIAGQVLKNK